MTVFFYDIIITLPIPDINKFYYLGSEDDLYNYLFDELKSSELCLFDDNEIQDVKNITQIQIDNFNKRIMLSSNYDYRQLRSQISSKRKNVEWSKLVKMNESTYKKIVLLFGDKMSKSSLKFGNDDVERVRFDITNHNQTRFYYSALILE